MGLGDRPSLVGDLDQLRILFTGLRLRVATQQDQSVQGDPPPIVEQNRPFLDVGRTRATAVWSEKSPAGWAAIASYEGEATDGCPLGG